MTVPRENLLEAVRVTLKRLETQHGTQADDPALQTLKTQVISTLAEMELREQTAPELEPASELPHPVLEPSSDLPHPVLEPSSDLPHPMLAAIAVQLAAQEAAAPALESAAATPLIPAVPLPLAPIEPTAAEPAK